MHLILYYRVKKNGPKDFVLLVASAKKEPPSTSEFKIGSETATLQVEYGDYSEALSKVVEALKEVRNPVFPRYRAVN